MPLYRKASCPVYRLIKQSFLFLVLLAPCSAKPALVTLTEICQIHHWRLNYELVGFDIKKFEKYLFFGMLGSIPDSHFCMTLALFQDCRTRSLLRGSAFIPSIQFTALATFTEVAGAYMFAATVQLNDHRESYTNTNYLKLPLREKGFLVPLGYSGGLAYNLRASAADMAGHYLYIVSKSWQRLAIMDFRTLLTLGFPYSNPALDYTAPLNEPELVSAIPHRFVVTEQWPVESAESGETSGGSGSARDPGVYVQLHLYAHENAQVQRINILTVKSPIALSLATGNNQTTWLAGISDMGQSLDIIQFSEEGETLYQRTFPVDGAIQLKALLIGDNLVTFILGQSGQIQAYTLENDQLTAQPLVASGARMMRLYEDELQVLFKGYITRYRIGSYPLPGRPDDIHTVDQATATGQHLASTETSPVIPAAIQTTSVTSITDNPTQILPSHPMESEINKSTFYVKPHPASLLSTTTASTAIPLSTSVGPMMPAAAQTTSVTSVTDNPVQSSINRTQIPPHPTESEIDNSASYSILTAEAAVIAVIATFGVLTTICFLSKLLSRH